MNPLVRLLRMNPHLLPLLFATVALSAEFRVAPNGAIHPVVPPRRLGAYNPGRFVRSR